MSYDTSTEGSEICTYSAWKAKHWAYQKFTCGHLQPTVLAGSSVADQYEIEASEALDLCLWCNILGLIQSDGNKCTIVHSQGEATLPYSDILIYESFGQLIRLLIHTLCSSLKCHRAVSYYTIFWKQTLLNGMCHKDQCLIRKLSFLFYGVFCVQYHD